MRKRSFLRGFFCGIATKLLCTVATVLALTGASYLYAAALDVPSPLHDGPFPPFSAGWIATQAFVIAGAALSGFACAHWSPRRSWTAPVALALLWLVGSAAKVPESRSLFVLALWLTISSTCILLGAFAYHRRFERDDA